MTRFVHHCVDKALHIAGRGRAPIRLIDTDDNLEHERQARALSIEFGGNAHMVEYPLTGAAAKRHAIGGSVSAAIA